MKIEKEKEEPSVVEPKELHIDLDEIKKEMVSEMRVEKECLSIKNNRTGLDIELISSRESMIQLIHHALLIQANFFNKSKTPENPCVG